MCVGLLPIRGAMPFLKCNEDAGLALIENGRLRWAFNVAASQNQHSKELRILPQCVGDFLAGRECTLRFEDVAAAMIGGRAESLRATDIARALNVSPSHVYSLIRKGELKACSRWHRGSRGSARVSVESFLGFLRRRAWPVPVAP
jgi:hypothetical protein